jgi:hypothetical protein
MGNQNGNESAGRLWLRSIVPREMRNVPHGFQAVFLGIFGDPYKLCGTLEQLAWGVHASQTALSRPGSSHG